MSHHAKTETTSLTRRAAIAGLGAGGLGRVLDQRPGAAQGFATAGHPLVGTWYLDSSSAKPTTARDLFGLHADGTSLEANADGSVRLGAWEATGPTTANLTIESFSRVGDINLGGITIRLGITLNPDGSSYAAEGMIALTAPDRARSGQAGPARGTASRFMVEAPSAPVMTLDELFTGPPPAATPAA